VEDGSSFFPPNQPVTVSFSHSTLPRISAKPTTSAHPDGFCTWGTAVDEELLEATREGTASAAPHFVQCVSPSVKTPQAGHFRVPGDVERGCNGARVVGDGAGGGGLPAELDEAGGVLMGSGLMWPIPRLQSPHSGPFPSNWRPHSGHFIAMTPSSPALTAATLPREYAKKNPGARPGCEGAWHGT
jgi:hypothetical protein